MLVNTHIFDHFKCLSFTLTEGKIKPDMTQNAINDLLKSEGIVKAKTDNLSAPTPKTSDADNDAVKVALAMVNAFMKSNCKDETIMNNWNVILDALK